MNRIKNSKVRRSQRILKMVHELHKQGYQGLGILPYMAPSGFAWRCAITPLHNLRIDNDTLRLGEHGTLVATYSSSDENLYFGWDDARYDTARDLAEKFARRFPRIAEAAKGTNWQYAGWLTEVLGESESGALPVAFDDSSTARGCLFTTEQGRLPLPPLPVKHHLPREFRI